jgi:hypothetical protein
MDEDLGALSREALVAEVKRLRAGIRDRQLPAAPRIFEEYEPHD